MQITPYLFFDGNCEEAFRLYAKCFGGNIVGLMKYGNSPGCENMSAEEREKVMHAALKVGDRLLMASDTPHGEYKKPQGLSIAIDLEKPEEAERVFAELSDKGHVQMPMAETFWAVRFGMVTDRFGTPWMVGCNKPQNPA